MLDATFASTTSSLTDTIANELEKTSLLPSLPKLGLGSSHRFEAEQVSGAIAGLVESAIPSTDQSTPELFRTGCARTVPLTGSAHRVVRTDTDGLTGLSSDAPIVSRTPSTEQTRDGELDFSDDLNPTRSGRYKDDYRLNLSEGGQVQLDLESSDFDTYLQVIDSRTGSIVAYDDDSGDGTDSQILFNAQAGVDYIVRATSYYAFDTGSYSISANASDSEPPDSPGFSSTYGYGLVDASQAVARAINTSRFSDVTDLGGNDWGNDMVNAPESWARGYTGRGVTVAVIDSGVDITHSDLRDNIWVNQDEVANDGIDNDGNGYVDDRYGWNFGVGQDNNNVMPGTFDSGQGHGTHVAGTIAADDNGTGTTGVAPDAQIMALRLGDVSGNRFTNAGSLAQAIRYAVDNGADVINMSLGWTDSEELRSALAYAAERNVITVSSAGNSSEPSPGTPAYYATQYGLSVGAVDRSGAIADFSNEAGSDSQMHHVMAPGVDIYSTLPDGEYGMSSGTSMAAPHVAGVVALMLSANPDLTHEQVRQILISSTRTSNTSTESLPVPMQSRLFELTD